MQWANNVTLEHRATRARAPQDRGSVEFFALKSALCPRDVVEPYPEDVQVRSSKQRCGFRKVPVQCVKMTRMPAHRAEPRLLSAAAGLKVVRDTIHGYISVDGRLVPLLDHPYMQRLRRISQTSMSSLVYPTMTGNRFEHSLGAMHLAQLGLLPMWRNSDPNDRIEFRREFSESLSTDSSDEEKARYPALFDPAAEELEFLDQLSVVIGAAALLHDVGHTAYSHALERFFDNSVEWISPSAAASLAEYKARLVPESRDFHEVAGLVIADRIRSDLPDSLSWTAISRVLWSANGERTCASALHDYISGEVDVDRIDYLLRDSNNSGTDFGSTPTAAAEQSPTAIPNG